MRERLCIALLIAIILLAYGNTLLNGFTMDDELYIFRNPTVTNLSLGGISSRPKPPTSFGRSPTAA